MRALAIISGRVERLAGRLLLFAPLCLGLGVGAYFRLPVEPTLRDWLVILFAALALGSGGLRLMRGRYAGIGILALGLATILAGLLVAGLRSEVVRAPVLSFRYYGPVEGRVVKIDRSGSDAVRLTLDSLRLSRVAPDEMPERVRVSLHGKQGYLTPQPGQRVAMTAFLSAPEGPVEPGGFDFRRMAWFDRIGAVGYTRAPALLLAPAPGGLGALFVHRIRAHIAAYVSAAIPGEAGAFAAAITTGDRAQMSPEALTALRGANLAHLLAISGLHMGLLTGFVFAALRYAMALVPGLADRVAIRKIAAVVALQAGAVYLALSGGNVATERAYIMVSVMFGAVLLDRRALTLRAVALAAILILLVQPEALTEPGFQMSFAATTALVAAFSALRDWPGWQPPRWSRAPLGVAISSLVAGLATAPFAAAHFNQVSSYGLIANLAAVPVMGALVMPLAVMAGVAAPFGLAWLPLALMRWPILWILWVSRSVSGLEGAVSHVPSPGPWVLPLIGLGGLVVVLGQGRGRLAGLAPLALALVLWAGVERPSVLVTSSGGLVGVIGPQGRALSKPRGDGFAAKVWLENDGDPVPQRVAFERPGFVGSGGERRFEIAGQRIRHETGQGAGARAVAACAEADMVITSVAVAQAPPSCSLYDKTRLARTGALAIYPGSPLRIVTVAAKSGARPWTLAARRDGAD
ncbi:MAG TPA: ComEC family competence protein [Rhodobacterales bacterium]|nr:ComEC family competence protein [Rhodobacterales bacterium]